MLAFYRVLVYNVYEVSNLIGERLGLLRTQNGYSRKDLAGRLDMPYTTYVNYETGAREPNANVLRQLSAFFEVSIDYLLGNTDDPAPPDVKKDTPSEVSDDDIMFALFDGDVDEITDEMYEDVKRYAQFLKEKKGRTSDGIT